MAEDATAPKVDTVEIKKEFLKNTENDVFPNPFQPFL